MARQPFITSRVWHSREGWSISFRTHLGRYRTLLTGAKSRRQAVRLKDLLESREMRAGRILRAAAKEGRA